MTKKTLFGLGLILMTFSLAPTAQAKNYEWTGFYLGANMGGAFGNANPETTTELTDTGNDYFSVLTDVMDVNDAGSDRLDPYAFISGGQVGYNYQRGRTVFGLETDFNRFNLERTQSNSDTFISDPNIVFTIRHHVSTNWLYTLRPRIGYSIGKFLFYGTGGMALTRMKFDGRYDDDNTPVRDNVSDSWTTLGWTLGAGFEYGLTKNWSVKSEYLYTNFRKFSIVSLMYPGGQLDEFDSPLRREVELDAHVVRLGVNYRF